MIVAMIVMVIVLFCVWPLVRAWRLYNRHPEAAPCEPVHSVSYDGVAFYDERYRLWGIDASNPDLAAAPQFKTRGAAWAQYFDYKHWRDAGSMAIYGKRGPVLRLVDLWKRFGKFIPGTATGEELKFGCYKEIYSKGRLYLTRLYFTPNVYLHYYHNEDGDAALHDHPWRWAFSFILWGWYSEDRLIGQIPGHVREKNGVFDVKCARVFTRRVKRRWFNLLLGSSWHRVHEVKPGTVTLFITRTYFKTWSFMRADGTVVWWQDYIREREQRGEKRLDSHGVSTARARTPLQRLAEKLPPTGPRAATSIAQANYADLERRVASYAPNSEEGKA